MHLCIFVHLKKLSPYTAFEVERWGRRSAKGIYAERRYSFMKKFNKSFLYKISSLCIALGGLIYAQGMCMMFFGEPDFKEVKED